MKEEVMWINDLLNKRKAQRTCVFIVEAPDPVRVWQLLKVIASKKHRLVVKYDWRGFSIIRVDSRNRSRLVEKQLKVNHASTDPLNLFKIAKNRGLLFPYKDDLTEFEITRLISDGSSLAIDTSTTSRSQNIFTFSPQGQQYINLDSALRIFDTYLKRTVPEQYLQNFASLWPIIFINHSNPNIEEAIRTWVRDTDKYYMRNTIVIITEKSAISIFPREILRLAYYIRAPLAYPSELHNLITEFVNKFEDLDLQMNEEEISEATTALLGLTLHEAESAILESIFQRKKIDPTFLVKYKLDIIKQEGLLEVFRPTFGFKYVGGMDYIKEIFINHIIKFLRNQKKITELGGTLPKGIILYGPPGTGKTYITKALAYELSVPFFKMDLSRVLSKWFGESEQRMVRLLQAIESLAPAVFFIDEFDAIASTRGTLQEHEASRRMKNILLDWLGDEERKTIIIAATNRIQDIDEAMRRRGRFSFIIPVLWPDYKSRVDIIKIHLRKRRQDPTKINVELIAKRTKFWSSGEIADFIQQAVNEAIIANKKVTTEFLLKVLNDYIVEGLEDRKKQFVEYIQIARKYTNRLSFIKAIQRLYDEELEETESKKVLNNGRFSFSTDI